MEFQSMECEGSSGANDTQYKENETSGGADCLYKCEMCRKSFETEKYLGLHMQVHVEESDKFCEESKFINNLIENDAIEIKSEFSEEDTTINCGEFHNSFAENADGRSKMTDFGLIRVKKEQYDDEIKSEPNSNLEQDGIKCEPMSGIEQDGSNETDVANDEFEFIKCEQPSDSLYSENDTSELSFPHYQQSSTLHIEQNKCNACNKTIIRKYSSRKDNCDVCRRCTNFVKQPDISDKQKLTRNIAQPKEKPHKCDVCGKSFAQKCHLTHHIKTHTGERRYKCEICEKRFTSNHNLKRHAIWHTGEKQYTCEICRKSFSQKSHLVTHSKLHTGQTPYVCEFCDKKVLDRHSLTKHVRMHTGEKPYECGFCDEKFSRKDYLVKHIRLHSGEELYKCDICNKSLSDQGGLVRHIRIHRGEKPYKCELCDKKFPEKHGLTKHMKLHTSKKCEEKFIHSEYFNTQKTIDH